MAHFAHDRESVTGDQLTPEQQRTVKAQYIYRFTSDNVPAWAKELRENGKPYPLQFVDDNDWLRNTRFNLLKNGSLANRGCYSTPTWPNGKD